MDRNGPLFVAMMKMLQSQRAEVTFNLSGGRTIKVMGSALVWNPHDDLIKIDNHTYVDVASITDATIQRGL
jgi:6-phosphogluconolactonase/glucosamine-6-phosphate isomerase/deaminase